MIKSFIIIVLVTSPLSLKAETHLPLTTNSYSVQATLWEGLSILLEKYKSFGRVKVTPAGRLTVKFEKYSVDCDSRRLKGRLNVQGYECTFSDTEFPWAMPIESVPGVLWSALSELQSMGSQKVKKEPNGALIVEDTHHTLTCQAGTVGTAAAVSYYCLLEESKN